MTNPTRNEADNNRTMDGIEAAYRQSIIDSLPAMLADIKSDVELIATCQRVQARHPRFNAEQVLSEARSILAAKDDRQALSLEQRDTESRREESEAAHADEANSERAFTKRAMVN